MNAGTINSNVTRVPTYNWYWFTLLTGITCSAYLYAVWLRMQFNPITFHCNSPSKVKCSYIYLRTVPTGSMTDRYCRFSITMCSYPTDKIQPTWQTDIISRFKKKKHQVKDFTKIFEVINFVTSCTKSPPFI